MANIKDKKRETALNKILAYKHLRGAWKECIDDAMEQYAGTDKYKLFEMLTNGRPMVPICMELYISQRNFYRWRDELINAVLLQAAYNKLIKP